MIGRVNTLRLTSAWLRVAALLAGLLAVSARSAVAAGQESPRIALFQTAADEESLKGLAVALDPVLAAALDQSSSVQVSARPSIDLPSVQLAVDCVRESVECMRAVADQAGVEGQVAGTLRRADESVVLTLVYFDGRGEGALRHATRKYDGDDRDQRMLDAAPQMVRELLGEVPAEGETQVVEGEPPPSAADPTTTADAPQDEASPLPVGPLVLGIGGVVAIGVGAGFGLAAKGTEDDYAKVPILDSPEPEAEIEEAEDLLDKAKSQALIANICFGVGAAAVAGSIVWWLLSSPDAEDTEQTSIVPVVTHRELGLVLRGSFAGRM